MPGPPPTAAAMSAGPNPEAILQLGLGFWGSKTMLSAVELDMFSKLAKSGPQTGDELRDLLGLHARSSQDFFDALVALGMLDRTDGVYDNTPSTGIFLDRAKPTYIGWILEMANDRLFGFWDDLTEGLRTGQPQNEVKSGGQTFEGLYADEEGVRSFAAAMTGVSMGTAYALTASFPWEQHKSVIDIGGAEGCVPVQLALAHSHLTGGAFELPPLKPAFDDYVAKFDLGDRLSFHGGDFFADDLPTADVLIMGHILHDWDLDQKRVLLEKAYAALDDGGTLIVYDAIIDDDRRENAFGLLMSLNMLIETPGGFDYTGADCQSWMRDVGFKESYVKPLLGPDSMVVAVK
jgi:hypothetical protein